VGLGGASSALKVPALAAVMTAGADSAGKAHRGHATVRQVRHEFRAYVINIPSRLAPSAGGYTLTYRPAGLGPATKNDSAPSPQPPYLAHPSP